MHGKSAVATLSCAEKFRGCVRSGEQFRNRQAAVGDRHRTVAFVQMFRLIDAERGVDGREKIGHAHGIGDR